jgi:hypothetical protein
MGARSQDGFFLEMPPRKLSVDDFQKAVCGRFPNHKKKAHLLQIDLSPSVVVQ